MKGTKTKPASEAKTRTGLPKLRTGALKALKIDPFNASILRMVIATHKLPAAPRAAVTNALRKSQPTKPAAKK